MRVQQLLALLGQISGMWFFLGRNRGQCAGADSRPSSGTRGTRAAFDRLGDRASVGVGWRTIRGERHQDRTGAASGVIDLDALAALLADNRPALVSVLLANNETGAIQPVREVAELVHEAGGVLHVDAVQALSKMPIDIKAIGADILTISAHKIGGPKGVGAMIVGDTLSGLEALIRGGQEQGRRAGTENVPGITGFGAAVSAAIASMEAVAARVRLQARLEKGLRSHPGTVIFSDSVPRLPNTTLMSARGLKAETTVIGFDLAGIAVSSGSACSSGKVQPSHVLQAMNADPALLQGAIRLSLGWDTTEADIDRCLEAWIKLSSVLGKASATGLEQF
jgi:cysteine desulfurase